MSVVQQNLKIYGLDPTNDSIRILLMEGAYENLVHETRIPGGFWTMSFTLPMTISEYNRWRD
ncbi:MAG: hypothetical protein IIC80_01280, partial [Chloroflexi bacterium]|nr:hypothetical protein [Chloroflexota bacterium]